MASILILDPHAASRRILEKYASASGGVDSIRAFADGAAALRSVRTETPDLVLIDCSVPDLLPFTLDLRDIEACRDVPLLVAVNRGNVKLPPELLAAKPLDFLSKPIDPHEYRARTENLLILRRQAALLQDRARLLQNEVQIATAEIRTREQETLLRLAKAGEYRDEDTGNHVVRMAQYCRILAERLGLPAEECALIEQSSPLHDIGKIGISDAILRKRGRLTPAEVDVIKTHTQIGYQILKGSPSAYLKASAVIALAHHERYDGNGYPGGLGGDEIPVPARIVAVADVYDALTSRRPYKRPWPVPHVVQYLREQREKQFDPECVDAFLAGLDQVMEVQMKYAEPPDDGQEHP